MTATKKNSQEDLQNQRISYSILLFANGLPQVVNYRL